jgi:hypothetical protein
VLDPTSKIDRLDLPTMHGFADGEASLVFPHFGLHLDLSAATDRLPVDPPIVAGPGRELVFARLGRPPVGPVEGGRATVRFAGQRHALPADRRLTQGNVIVISVPTGEEPELELSDAGRTQSIRLRPGTVVAPSDGYYPIRSGRAAISCLVRSSNSRANNTTLGLWLSATLIPYTDEKGWATAGRLWLVVEVRPYFSGGPGFALTLDAARSLRLTGPTGAVPLAGQIPVGSSPAEGSPAGLASATIDAPREPAPVTIAYSPVGSMTLDGAAVPWSYPCTGETATATLK